MKGNFGRFSREFKGHLFYASKGNIFKCPFDHISPDTINQYTKDFGMQALSKRLLKFIFHTHTHTHEGKFNFVHVFIFHRLEKSKYKRKRGKIPR